MATHIISTANYRLFKGSEKRWSSISLPEITNFYLSLFSLIPRGVSEVLLSLHIRL
jgi:hypothetical protein